MDMSLTEQKHLLLLGLLGQQDSLDVRQDTALGNSNAGQEFVQLLVVADGELEMTRDDTRLLVVTGGVASELEHLSSQVLHYGSKVDRCTCTDAFGIVALPQETMDPANWELQASTAGTGL